MGQQKVQVLIVMLLEIFDKCRGLRSSVKAVDDERVAGIAVDDQPVSVTLEPAGEALPFTYENGVVRYTVPKIECSAMAVIACKAD